MSWKGFMNRLVVGKKRNKDYSHGDLPTNRRQVFKFAYKQRWLTLLNANLLSLIFILPYALFEILIVLSGAKAKDMTVAQKNSQLMSFALLRIPLLALAGVGIAGIAYVVRKICWDETLSFKKDFFRGVRTGGKQFAEIGAFLGVCTYLLEALFNLFVGDGNASFTTIYVLVTIGFLMLVMLIVLIYHMGLCSTYNIGFFAALKSAILLTFKRLFFNILMVISGILPVAIWFIIPTTITYFIGIVVLVFGGLSFATVTCFLFTNRLFDDYINVNEYPEYVNKGMYVEGEREEDEVVTHSEEEINALAELLASDIKKGNDEDKEGAEQEESPSTSVNEEEKVEESEE